MEDSSSSQGSADLSLTINGRRVTVSGVPHSQTLVELIRERLGLVGTKVSCEVQVCGACTVLVDESPVSSCCMLAYDVNNRTVTTIEGLAKDGVLHRVQQSMVDAWAIQCGFCTPGMVMTIASLLSRPDVRTQEEIRQYMSGTLCRCTGYRPILQAALRCLQKEDAL